MKAHRTCPSCSASVHVKRNPCHCGHVFPKKSQLDKPVLDNLVRDGDTAKAKLPTPRAISAEDNDKFSRRVTELQNHVNQLEVQFEKKTKQLEEMCKRIDLNWRKWYAGQCELIYERAWKHFGGEGKLYHSPHGDNKDLFKEMSDETGVFNPPPIGDIPTDNLTDEQIQNSIALSVFLRKPVERDLVGDGVVIDDALSIPYANLQPKENNSPSVAAAVKHVKYLIGQKED